MFDMKKLKDWKLALPVDAKGGITGFARQVTNLAAFSDPDYFYADGDNSLVFRAMAEGATTSGSKYARSELREMIAGKEAAWQLKTGGTLTAMLKVSEVPTVRDPKRERKIVIGQIHGKDEELVRLYYVSDGKNGVVNFHNDRAGSKNKEVVYKLLDADGKQPIIPIGDEFSYKIDARGSDLVVSVFHKGKTYTSASKINSVWQKDRFYFKVGVYLGVNETFGDGFGEVSFSDFAVKH